jgi:membrane fusion protein (multidrug efflux system)
MFARVNAVFDVREDARVIPEEAIVPQGGKQYVIKLLDDPAATGKPAQGSKITQRVEVKVGLRSPGRVEILEGLSAGETVITSGQQRVQKDGTRVTVVAATVAARPSAGASAARAPLAAVALGGTNPCGPLAAPAVVTSPSSGKPAAPPPASAARNPA